MDPDVVAPGVPILSQFRWVSLLCLTFSIPLIRSEPYSFVSFLALVTGGGAY